MKKIMTKEEIIATTKQVVAEKKAEKEAKAKEVVKEEKATSEKVKPSIKKVAEKKAVKEENPAKEVKPSKAEEKAEKKVKKPSKKATKAVEEKSEKPSKEVEVIVKSFKAFKALTDKNKVKITLEWSESDKVHFQANFGKELPKQKGSYFEVTTPILVESNNVLLWSPKLKVTHLMLNEDFKDQSLNGIPFTIEVVEG